MFQYSFARTLALITGKGIRISRRFFRNDSFNRTYSLNNLNIPDDVKFMTYAEELKAHSKFYVVRKLHDLTRKLKGLERNFYTRNIIYFPDSDRYNPELLCSSYGDEIIINGYFQAWKYFSDYYDVIRSELKVSRPPSSENVEMIRELSGCESVCVHFRRGDYIELGLNICGYEYYYSAMKYISEHVKSPVYYFFSNTHDDINWLKGNYDFRGYNVKYIDLNNPDYEELRLMYSCRHFIIANSSMSWWGSCLSDNPNKITCAPSYWNKNTETRSMNISFPDWVIIDT